MTPNSADLSFGFLGHTARSQGIRKIGKAGSASLQWTAGCIAGWMM